MRAMAAIDDGLDDARAAALFGVSTKSIGRWRARRQAGGDEGLLSGTPGRRPGSGRFLTESEEAALKQTIIEFTPDDLGLGGLLWTSRKVDAFIKVHFKVRFSHGGLIKLFRRLGLSFQRPDRRAREADPEAMAAWTGQEYPAIRAKAAAFAGGRDAMCGRCRIPCETRHRCVSIYDGKPVGQRLQDLSPK